MDDESQINNFFDKLLKYNDKNDYMSDHEMIKYFKFFLKENDKKYHNEEKNKTNNFYDKNNKVTLYNID